MQPLELHIIHTLRYYAYFSHALTAAEILRYLGTNCEASALQRCLDEMTTDGRLFKQSGYYALEQEHVCKRIAHRDYNKRMLRLAQWVGAVIARFPFVEGVYVSGSLSKEGARKGDDIDFFVITSARRLWTARMLLMAFKKLFLFNSRKYFCINLLKADDALVINRRNVYIATEVASLIAVYNAPLHEHFLASNAWVNTYFPNLRIPELKEVRKRPFGLIEKWLLGPKGDAFEAWARRRFNAHLKQQKKADANAHFEYAKHTAAHFPNSPEKAILDYYNAHRLHSAA